MILFAYESLQRDAPELLEKGLALAPEPDGTIGGTTMIIGLGNMLAARMKVFDRTIPTEADDKLFVECARKVFQDVEVGGNYSSQRKRDLINEFTTEFFRDVIEDEESVVGAHEGIPIFLCLLLGTSAFNVSKFAKPKVKRGRKPKTAVPDEPTTPAPEPEVVVEEVLQEKVVESDTDPEWVDEKDDVPPWVNDEDDEDDPFGTESLDKLR